MICLICMPAAFWALGIHIRQITRAHVTTINWGTCSDGNLFYGMPDNVAQVDSIVIIVLFKNYK